MDGELFSAVLTFLSILAFISTAVAVLYFSLSYMFPFDPPQNESSSLNASAYLEQYRQEQMRLMKEQEKEQSKDESNSHNQLRKRVGNTTNSNQEEETSTIESNQKELLSEVDKEIELAVKKNRASYHPEYIYSPPNFNQGDKPQSEENQIKSNYNEELSILSSNNASIIEKKEAIKAMYHAIHQWEAPHHRDLIKISEFCKAILAKDGLDSLQELRNSDDLESKKLSSALLEKIIPHIWG